MTYHLHSRSVALNDIVNAVCGERFSRAKKMNGVKDAGLASTVIARERGHPF